MAAPLKVHALQEAMTCPPGFLVDAEHMCVAKGLMVKFNLEGPVIRSGNFSPTPATLGPIGQIDDGQMLTKLIVSQMISAAYGDFPDSESTAAAFLCATEAGPGPASFLPSIAQLQAIQAVLPMLAKAFEHSQNDPRSYAYKVTPQVKAAIISAINNREPVTLLSSNQDLSLPGSAQTLSPLGVVGTLTKDQTASFICLKKFSPDMLSLPGRVSI